MKWIFNSDRACGVAIVAAVALVTASATAGAAMVVQVENAPVQNVSAVSTNGAAELFHGARATAFFNDGSSATALFVAAAPQGNACGSFAQGGAFQVSAISACGSASTPDFEVVNQDTVRRLVGLQLDGLGDGAGQVAFDRDITFLSGLILTEGSSTGTDLRAHFEDLPPSVQNATGTYTYRGAIGLSGAAPLNDLYRIVEFRFSLPNIVGLTGTIAFLDFSVDADTVVYDNATAVPVPGAVWLLLSGALAVASSARRRAR